MTQKVDIQAQNSNRSQTFPLLIGASFIRFHQELKKKMPNLIETKPEKPYYLLLHITAIRGSNGLSHVEINFFAPSIICLCHIKV